MTAASWAFLAVALVAVAGDWVAVSGGVPRLAAAEYACKPAVPLALLGCAATMDPVDTSLRAWVVAFLACCLVGDVLLMLPGDRTPLFAGGLLAFLVAHVVLVVGLATAMSGGWVWVAVAGVALAAAVAVPAALVLRGVARSEPVLRGPVVVYMVALLAMAALAVAAGAGAGRPGADPALALGGLCFLASDTLLALDRFVRPLPRRSLVVHVTYHAALVLLVLSLLGGR